MEPVQIDAQPLGQRLQLVIRRNRAARQPFVGRLRRNWMVAAMPQIEMQRELRPACHLLGTALQGELQAFGERPFLVGGWHRKIVQLSQREGDNQSGQV
jgi:hypothetical protein